MESIEISQIAPGWLGIIRGSPDDLAATAGGADRALGPRWPRSCAWLHSLCRTGDWGAHVKFVKHSNINRERPNAGALGICYRGIVPANGVMRLWRRAPPLG